MPILRLQYVVKDFTGWKSLFDVDPIDRKSKGVISYQMARSVADPNLVMIDVEVGTIADAEALLETLQRMWAGPGKAVMTDAQAHIINVAETVVL